MTNRQEAIESFPRLLLNNLKLHAERWVKEYPDVPFNSITLYHFSPTKFRKYARVAIQTQYAVVFEISDEDETLSLTNEEARKADWEIITGKKPQNPWETFRSDMDDDAFLTPDFLNVYKEPPSKDFRAEWRFFVKLLNTELGPQIRIEEPHFTLWDGGHGEAFEIGGQICEVKREIENWEMKQPRSITEEKIKEEKAAELKSRLAELETKLQNVGKNKSPVLEPDSNVDTKTNSFVLSGEYWEVKYNGKKATFRNTESIRYIAYLLQYPEKSFSLNELKNLIKGVSPEPHEQYSKFSEEQFEKENLSLEDLSVDELSPTDKAKMEEATQKVWDTLQTVKKKGITDKIKKAEEQWNNTVRHFDNEYGVRIKPKGKRLTFYKYNRLNKENENLRKNIGKQIDTAIKTIEKAISGLGKHLSTCINKGQNPCYRPVPPVEWIIKL